jgi:hypothetical protein
MQQERNDGEARFARIIKIITDCLIATTIHTVYDIYMIKDYFVRAFLLACLLTSAGFCCYLTINTLIDFFSFNVLTTSSVVSDIPAQCKKISKKKIHLRFAKCKTQKNPNLNFIFGEKTFFNIFKLILGCCIIHNLFLTYLLVEQI